jgi:hypothetical protein
MARMNLDRIAKPLRQIPPRNARPITVENRFHKKPVVLGVKKANSVIFGVSATFGFGLVRPSIAISEFALTPPIFAKCFRPQGRPLNNQHIQMGRT